METASASRFFLLYGRDLSGSRTLYRDKCIDIAFVRLKPHLFFIYLWGIPDGLPVQYCISRLFSRRDMGIWGCILLLLYARARLADLLRHPDRPPKPLGHPLDRGHTI